MAGNELCGIDYSGKGTYTTEGITKLCEALKGSAVTSLKCAAARAFAFLSAPLDSRSTHLCSHARSLQRNRLGPKAAAALAEGLKGNTTLQKLE